MADFTTKYNTKLTPAQEQAFQTWLKENGRSANDLYDYDLRGAYLSGAEKAANGHLPDTYKKPNHPTFSSESQYSGQGGFQGGQWIAAPDGHWVFAASPTNVQFHGIDGLTDYFSRVEPSSSLIISGGQ